MNVTEAIYILRTGAVQAGSAAYPDQQCEQAIKEAIDDFALHCRAAMGTTGTVALGSADVTFSLSTLQNFRVRNFIRMEISPYNQVDHVSYDTIAQSLANPSGTATGTGGTSMPTQVAFFGSTGYLNTPAGTSHPRATIFYYATPTSWNYGSGGTTTINIDDELLRPVIRHGAAWKLQKHDPDAGYGEDDRKSYEAWRTRVAGQVGDDRGINFANRRKYLE